MKLTLLLCCALVVAGRCLAEKASFDFAGRVTSMVYGGDELPVHARIQIPSPDWTTVSEPLQADRDATRQGWQGSILMADTNKSVAFRQTVSVEGDRLWLSVEVMAQADIEAAGIYYALDVLRGSSPTDRP